MRKIEKLQTGIRLSILNPKSKSNSVFGRGIATLCQGVKDTGSLNAASKSIGMAYSKAWRIIKDTEAALNIQLLIRNGAHGSQLTKEGEKLLEIYTTIDEKVSKEALKLYQELSK